MLYLPGRPVRSCDGVSRRELLRAGGLGLLGLNLPEFLQMQAYAGAAAKSEANKPKAKNVILLFLQGGPSHIDIWDP